MTKPLNITQKIKEAIGLELSASKKIKWSVELRLITPNMVVDGKLKHQPQTKDGHIIIMALQKQIDFHMLSTPFCATIGAKGCSKTETICQSVLINMIGKGDDICVAGTTHEKMKASTFKRLRQMLVQHGIPFASTTTPSLSITTSDENLANITFLSVSDPVVTFSSLEFRQILIDECTLLNDNDFNEVWTHCIGRLRGTVDIKNYKRKLCLFGTPEGLGSVYRMFSVNPTPDHSIVYVSAYDNLFLSSEYIENAIKSYTSAQRTAYVDGRFTVLFSGQVYCDYNETCNSDEQLDKNKQLLMGCDFNYNRLCAVLIQKHVERKTHLDHHVTRGPNDYNTTYHVIGEYYNLLNTQQLIERIKTDYKGMDIICYPDVSGNSNSSSASLSDIQQIREANIKCNPRMEVKGKSKGVHNSVKDSVSSVNKGYRDGLLFINKSLAPNLHKMQESQVYDKSGAPTKDGTEDINDGFRYAIEAIIPYAKRQHAIDFNKLFRKK